MDAIRATLDAAYIQGAFGLAGALIELQLYMFP